MTLPKKLSILRSQDSLKYQVCEDEEELSTPYILLSEHETEIKAWEAGYNNALALNDKIKDRLLAENDTLRAELKKARGV